MRTRNQSKILQKTSKETISPVEETNQALKESNGVENQPGEKDSSLTKDLEELYKNIKSVPNYSAKIGKFLQSYGLHSVNKRIVKKTFPRRRVVARFKNDLWQADLIEYQQLKYQNSGYKFILLVIDVFSKVIYVEPLKKKTGEQTAEAMEKILDQATAPPVMLVTDGGKEFFNSFFRKVMIGHNINHFRTPTRTRWKAAVAERANRTIKTRINRWMQNTRSKKWLDVFRQIVDNYNHTPHSAHKMIPLEVSDENRKTVYKRLYPYSAVTVVCRLKKGDKVRKIREKTDFEKGYTPNWSEEIFTISKVRQKNTVCWYKLADSTGQELPGIWYFYQLNLVARNDN